MKRILFVVLAALLLASSVEAARPPMGEDAWITPIQAAEGTGAYTSSAAETAPSPQGEGCGNYSDADLNMIANVVNGEVGGISGTVVLTYADGSQLWTDGNTIRMIHARIVDNQVRSWLFPSTVDGCVRQCWGAAYASTGWRESSQWQHCREDVVEALSGGISVPGNVFAATFDPWFASYGPGWYLWARVDWDTGWCSGTFYYYQFN